jgi:CBS domain-containing protein
MQRIAEIMTRDVRAVAPHETIRRAAQMMDELNIGALPVCDGDQLVGMVTDRDITVRATSVGMTPDDSRVEQVMSSDVRTCFEDQTLDEVLQQMANVQVRRVPVVSHDAQPRLVGIVALGDLAARAQIDQEQVERTVREISTPSEPDRSQVGTQSNPQASGNEGAGSGGLGSDTGTSTGFAGSDMVERMQADRGNNSNIRSGNSMPGQPVISGIREGTDNLPGAGAGGVGADGAAGASGGTAGTAGSAGSDVGAKP